VGAGKCGSSSLQSALSLRPVFASFDASARYEYACIVPEYTGLLRGEMLIRGAAQMSPAGYCCSSAAKRWAGDENFLARLNEDFIKMAKANVIPILSWEEWLYDASAFADHTILRRLGLSAKIVVFVRPQVPWINSAWWQWGAWSGQEFDDWLEIWAKEVTLWADLIRSWQSVPGVRTVEVYAATRDVVAAFFRSIGAPAPDVEVSNKSLDADLVRFFQRNREFRPNEHASEIDFVLQRCLAPSPKETPWVIPWTKVAELTEYFRPSNEDLLSLVSPSERAFIENDPQWWDAEAYRHREVASPTPPVPTIEEVEDLARRALRAVVSLEERVRMLQPCAGPNGSAQCALPALRQELAAAQASVDLLETKLAAKRMRWPWIKRMNSAA
ncbi:MAG: hypothetical protein WBP94_09790, partial [Rhodomicrobiaceae bacterium]